MTQPNQQNSTRQRTVLLAPDSSNSVIGEVVDGETHVIAYSAYGEQSAAQPVETRLGFNGQLREAEIGWYLLGNGYRAYNPRLMRFHSPDSLSPFGAGGMNSYVYCSNEPINSEDPTGRIRVKIKPIRSLAPQRARTPPAPQTPPAPERPSVIVENPNYSSPKTTQPTTKNSLEVPIERNPVAVPIATLERSSNTANLQASEFQEVPKLKPMIDPYFQPLQRGKRKMPRLSISATEAQIKKNRQLNPIVKLIRDPKSGLFM